MVCNMSRWDLNKEQEEGSGGLQVALEGFLPAYSEDGSPILPAMKSSHKIHCHKLPFNWAREFYNSMHDL